MLLEQGHRSNNLIVTLQYEGEALLELRLKYTTHNKEEQLCLYDIDCGYDSKTQWNESLTTVDSSFNLTIQQAYDAYVEYECGKARGFNITGWPTTEYLPSTVGMRCNDMEQWIYEAPATSSVEGQVHDDATMPVCSCEYLPITHLVFKLSLIWFIWCLIGA